MSIMLTKRKNVQFREGSVILLAGTGSHTCTCPVSFTERFLFVGQYKESDYLFRKICHNRHGFSFFPNSGLAQMPPSCLRSNSKSLGSTTSNMAYTVSGRAEHPLQQLLLSQTGSWCATGCAFCCKHFKEHHSRKTGSSKYQNHRLAIQKYYLTTIHQSGGKYPPFSPTLRWIIVFVYIT